MWKLTLAPEFLDLDAMDVREVAYHAIHVGQAPSVPVRARAVVAVGEVDASILDIDIVLSAHVVDDSVSAIASVRAAFFADVEGRHDRSIAAHN